LKLMKTGDTWELAIPSELGYGADGAGDTIPPNQALVFHHDLGESGIRAVILPPSGFRNFAVVLG
jgi:FKBP-type peptidyl-prolyl cis-trans isomerase FklB